MNTLTWIILAIIALLIIVAFVVLWFKNRIIAKKIVLALVIEAENKFGSNTGDIKYAYVVGLLWPKLPIIIKLFITQNSLGNFINEAVEYLQQKLGEKRAQNTPLIAAVKI